MTFKVFHNNNCVYESNNEKEADIFANGILIGARSSKEVNVRVEEWDENSFIETVWSINRSGGGAPTPSMIGTLLNYFVKGIR